MPTCPLKETLPNIQFIKLLSPAQPLPRTIIFFFNMSTGFVSLKRSGKESMIGIAYNA